MRARSVKLHLATERPCRLLLTAGRWCADWANALAGMILPQWPSSQCGLSSLTAAWSPAGQSSFLAWIFHGCRSSMQPFHESTSSCIQGKYGLIGTQKQMSMLGYLGASCACWGSAEMVLKHLIICRKLVCGEGGINIRFHEAFACSLSRQSPHSQLLCPQTDIRGEQILQSA